MTVWNKILCPLLCVVILVSTSAAQPWLDGVLDIQAINRSLVGPQSEHGDVMPVAYNPIFKGKLLPAGSWGGKHISMEVTAQQTKVEYDCAHGAISSKILLDSRGRFVVNGTHVEEHGGPTRQTAETESYPVQFKGSVRGKKMKLTVTRTVTREIIGTFTLVHGQESELVKCR